MRVCDNNNKLKRQALNASAHFYKKAVSYMHAYLWRVFVFLFRSPLFLVRQDVWALLQGIEYIDLLRCHFVTQKKRIKSMNVCRSFPLGYSNLKGKSQLCVAPIHTELYKITQAKGLMCRTISSTNRAWNGHCVVKRRGTHEKRKKRTGKCIMHGRQKIVWVWNHNTCKQNADVPPWPEDKVFVTIFMVTCYFRAQTTNGAACADDPWHALSWGRRQLLCFILSSGRWQGFK